jgi:hypothetical protein
LQRAGGGLQFGDRRFERGQRAEIVGRRAGEALQHRLGLFTSIDADEQIVALEVHSFDRVVLAVFGRDQVGRELGAVGFHFLFDSALARESLVYSGEIVLHGGFAAGNVHHNRQRRFFVRPIDDRQRQLAGDHAIEIVVGKAEPAGEVAEFVAELFVEAFAEVGHHLVVEHTTELRAFEMFLSRFGLGNRHVAFGGRGQQHVARRGGNCSGGIDCQTNERFRCGAAKLGKTQGTTP